MNKLILGLILSIIIIACNTKVIKNETPQTIFNEVLDIKKLIIKQSEFKEHLDYYGKKYILINETIEPYLKSGELNDSKNVFLKKKEWFEVNKYPHFIDFYKFEINNNDSADIRYLYRSGNKDFNLKLVKEESEWVIKDIEIGHLPSMYMTEESELHKKIYKLLYPENINKTDLEIEKERLNK